VAKLEGSLMLSFDIDIANQYAEHRGGIKFNTSTEHEKEILGGPNIRNTQAIIVNITHTQTFVPDFEGGNPTSPLNEKLYFKISHRGKTRT